MQALVLSGTQQSFKHEIMPDPVPGEGEALVSLKAAAFNRRDYWITTGKYPGLVFPSIIGSDGAGICNGQEVVINPGIHWGDDERVQGSQFRVLGNPDQGTFAQKIVVPANHIYAKPQHLSWEEAAALPLAGLTAYRSLVVQGQAKTGDRVLISGVGGGVALMAMQFALAIDLEVYVTSGTDSKIERAVEMGAAGGVNYRQEGWAKDLKARSGGFDLVIDSAGGDGFTDLMKTLNPAGRIVMYGGTMGTMPPLKPWPIFWLQMTIKGSTMGSQKNFKDMLDFVELYQVTPVVDKVFELAQGQEALNYLAEGKQFGKVVMTIPQ